MDIRELLNRLEEIANGMHSDVNGDLGKYGARTDWKHAVRGWRDQLRELLEESGR